MESVGLGVDKKSFQLEEQGKWVPVRMENAVVKVKASILKGGGLIRKLFDAE